MEDRGTLGDIVRDHRGNYWVAQGDRVNIYSPAGIFWTSVGRRGQGPMEFQFAQPVHTDSAGRVHIFDGGNLRVTVVAPDLTISEESRVPFPAYLVTPLADGRRYAVSWWIPNPDRIGLPLHIIQGREILRSFGVVEGGAHGSEALTAFSARRVLATDPVGRVFSAEYYDYSVEAWTEQGARVAAFEGPRLNERPVIPGPWTDDNPPANRIRDIHVDRAGRLWLILRVRRPEWRGRMVERVNRDGRVSLQSADGTLKSYYRSRIDVVDQSTCSFIASTWHEGVLLTFIEDGMITELHHATDGSPYVNIWRVTMRK